MLIQLGERVEIVYLLLYGLLFLTYFELLRLTLILYRDSGIRYLLLRLTKKFLHTNRRHGGENVKQFTESQPEIIIFNVLLYIVRVLLPPLENIIELNTIALVHVVDHVDDLRVLRLVKVDEGWDSRVLLG